MRTLDLICILSHTLRFKAPTYHIRAHASDHTRKYLRGCILSNTRSTHIPHARTRLAHVPCTCNTRTLHYSLHTTLCHYSLHTHTILCTLLYAHTHYTQLDYTRTCTMHTRHTHTTRHLPTCAHTLDYHAHTHRYSSAKTHPCLF